MENKEIVNKNNSNKWEIFSHILRIIEIIAIVGGVYFAGMQIRDVRNMQSAQMMLEFNNDLNNQINAQIITTIEDDQPIFLKNGGKFTSTDIDKYLTNYELLNNIYEAGLITDDMLYNAFSYDVVKTYKNKEIKDYLFEIRKKDKLFFAGFERLAKSLEISK